MKKYHIIYTAILFTLIFVSVSCSKNFLGKKRSTVNKHNRFIISSMHIPNNKNIVKGTIDFGNYYIDNGKRQTAPIMIDTNIVKEKCLIRFSVINNTPDTLKFRNFGSSHNNLVPAMSYYPYKDSYILAQGDTIQIDYFYRRRRVRNLAKWASRRRRLPRLTA